MSVFVGADDEPRARDRPVRVILGGPGGEEIFLREVEVWVGNSEGGRVFGHGERGGAQVYGVVLSAGLKEKALRNDGGEGEGGEEV